MAAPHPLDMRCLDVADLDLDAGQRRRADALLERIVATPLPTTIAPAPPLVPTRARTPRVGVWLSVAGAAITVGFVALPAGPGGSATAYASWTGTPTAVAATDQQAVTHACRTRLRDYTHGDGRIDFDPATIPVVLAERRGDYVAVLFRSDSPNTSAACVAANRPDSTSVHDVNTSVGSTTGPATAAPPGRVTENSISQFGGDTPASFADGEAGAGVVGVTIHAGEQVVTATVKDGRYAAWWPGKAFTDEPHQPNGRGGPRENLSYDVILSDGTNRSSALPWRPSRVPSLARHEA